LSFPARIKKHTAFEQQVIERIEAHGFDVLPFGVEYILPKEHWQKLMRLRDDPVSKFVRFRPDRIIVGRNKIYLCDPKSPSTEYRNIAIELDAVETYRFLGWLRIPVFVVVKGFRACWASDIEFKRVYKDARWTKGSKTPFGLLDERTSKLMPLDRFLRQLKVRRVQR